MKSASEMEKLTADVLVKKRAEEMKQRKDEELRIEKIHRERANEYVSNLRKTIETTMDRAKDKGLISVCVRGGFSDCVLYDFIDQKVVADYMEELTKFGYRAEKIRHKERNTSSDPDYNIDFDYNACLIVRWGEELKYRVRDEHEYDYDDYKGK